jgi:hypothetical protein
MQKSILIASMLLSSTLLSAAENQPVNVRQAAMDRFKSEDIIGKYVRVAVAWHVDQKCKMLNADDHSTFEKDVGASTVRVAALSEPIVGSKVASLNFVMALQQKAADFAAGMPDCGQDAKKTLNAGRVEAAELNQSLTTATR